MNKSDTILLLNQLNLKPNKNLGQNFLIDRNIVKKMLSIANITPNDIVLEIGSGLGAILGDLVIRAKKVYAYEVDTILFNHLESKFKPYSNLILNNSDILESAIPKFDKVVSNIPYSITGPIFEKIFYVDHPPEGVMIIEKNIADRVINPGEYKNFSRISILFNAFMEPIAQYSIPSNVFYPVPRIKLSLIHAKAKEKIDPFLLDESKRQFFFALVKGIMPYKNKNLTNALVLFFNHSLNTSISKQTITQLLTKNNIKDDKFALSSVNFFLNLSKILLEYRSKI